MKIESIEFENFKSFRGFHKFEFSQFPSGLHFLTGKNQVEEEVGANGAGKSTLLDAVTWALYGKTLRNLRASSVHSWNIEEKHTRAIIIFTIRDTHYILERKWNPNELKLASEDAVFYSVTQDDLQKLLPLSYDAFINSIIIGQFSSMFFDMTPANKLTLFSDIMGLDFWRERSEKASERAKEEKADLTRLENDVRYFEGRITQLQESLEGLRAQSMQFEHEKVQRLDALTLDIRELEKREQSEKNELKELSLSLDLLMNDKTSAEQETDSSEKLKIANYDLHEVLQEKRQINGMLKQIATDMKQLRTLGATCPLCKQGIDDLHIEEEDRKLQRAKRKLLNNLAEAETLQLELEREIQDEEERLADIKDKLYKKEQKIRNGQKALAEKQRDVAKVSAQIGAKEDLYDQEQNKNNPYEKQLEKNTSDIALYKKKQKELAEDISTLKKKASATEYWVSGFKRVRLFVIEEALTYLELEVNNVLADLGLAEWTIKFDVEKETKSGSVSKGFHVFIESPRSEGLVPWEAWSGGESQRLRLAGTLGLANLILTRNGIESNLEILDEPTAHMDAEGIESILHYLHKRAKVNGKQIWLIDHHSHNFGGFASRVEVQMTDDGSIIKPIQIEETVDD